MPIMSQPSWGDNPLVKELIRRATQLGLADPSNVMLPPGMGLVKPAVTALSRPALSATNLITKAAPEAVGGYSAANALSHPGAQAMMDRLAAQAAPTVRGMESAGTFAGDRTVGALHKLTKLAVPGTEASSRFAPVAETLGEMHPDFTAVGGEGLYNAGKGGISSVMDPTEAAYHRLLLSGGR